MTTQNTHKTAIRPMGRAEKAVAKRRASKVDFAKLQRAGTYCNLYEKLARDLARAYQRAENPDYSSISWACQLRAQEFFNEHGFEATLAEFCRVDGSPSISTRAASRDPRRLA